MLGRWHPNVATSLNNLAALLSEMGQYAVAEPLLHRTIAIDKKIYGPEHPRIAADLNNLAALYNAQGCAAYFCCYFRYY